MKSLRLSSLIALLTIAPCYCKQEPVDSGSLPPCQITLPNRDDSVKFAVAGDAGTGDTGQWDVARQMAGCHQVFKFDFVIMPGDNLYGSENPNDYSRKFEEPYKPLLDAGVAFYAALGNHDKPAQRLYKNFHMNGERYYKFDKGKATFLALDSTYMSPDQLSWAEKELSGSDKPWKIVFFHHPLYSSGRTHGSDVELRKVLEPLFINHGVDAVFAGHEHFYQRIKPQKEVHYFISGAAGQLRRGDVEQSPLDAAHFDQDNSFMLVEIAGDTMYFQSISRTGQTVDQGSFSRREAPRITVAQSDQDAGAANSAPENSQQGAKRGENP